MNPRAFLALLLGALCLPASISCSGSGHAADLAPTESRITEPAEYLVTFADALDPASVEKAPARAKLQTIRRYALQPGLVHVSSPLGLEELREVLGDAATAVRPNRLLCSTASEAAPASVQASTLPDDPHFALQWGLRNVGQTFNHSQGTLGADVRAAQGWAHATGTRVIVAVLDTGIDLEHEDLAANLWLNTAEANGQPGIDDDANGYVDDQNGWNFADRRSALSGSPNVRDIGGHGTEVASIVGAVGNNAKGMSGVAWSCRLMPLQVFHRFEGGLVTDVATVIAALEYAVLNGAQVSSNSWGAYCQAHEDDFLDLGRAIEIAGRSGHVFVASAGNGVANEGSDNDWLPFFPASFPYDNIVAVTSVGFADELPSNVNWGAASVDLAAPGRQILTADAASHSYRFVDGGTSYATPHVAAAAALVLGQSGASSWSAAQVRERLLQSARPLPSMLGKTVSGGVLDLGRLLEHPTSAGEPVEAALGR